MMLIACPEHQCTRTFAWMKCTQEKHETCGGSISCQGCHYKSLCMVHGIHYLDRYDVNKLLLNYSSKMNMLTPTLWSTATCSRSKNACRLLFSAIERWCLELLQKPALNFLIDVGSIWPKTLKYTTSNLPTRFFNIDCQPTHQDPKGIQIESTLLLWYVLTPFNNLWTIIW